MLLILMRGCILIGFVVIAVLAAARLAPAHAVSALRSAINSSEPAIQLLGLYASGRVARACGPVDVYRAARLGHDLERRIRRIEASSQLVRIDGSYALLQTEYGPFWVERSGGPKVIAYSLAEQEIDVYRLADLRPGSIVLDCGANLGTVTRFALRRGAKTVVAIDPDPESIECLRRTFASEIAAGRVILYTKGVWDANGTLSFHRKPDDSWGASILAKEGSGTLGLPVTTIDTLVHDLRLRRVDFIKMDIEGAEVPALRGAKATISRFHPRMSICVYHLPGDAVNVPATVRGARADYQTNDRCALLWDLTARPDIVYFR